MWSGKNLFRSLAYAQQYVMEPGAAQKLGWIAASGPPRLLEEAKGRLEILADAYLSAGTPIMNALPSLLAESEVFALPCRERLVANISLLRGILEGPRSPHRYLRCEGGWTAIVESPRLLSEEESAMGLLREEGLGLYPGYFFDMESEAFFTVGLILPPSSIGSSSLYGLFRETTGWDG